MKIRCFFSLEGIAQGVGLRPLLYTLSEQYQLGGWVQNTDKNVRLVWQGESKQIEMALSTLTNRLPNVLVTFKKNYKLKNKKHFKIYKSHGNTESSDIISPDLGTCVACLKELYDKNDRRYLYPFINCTHCGPRYTISYALPYDRQTTSMRSFELCSHCKNEYQDPHNRRFHAQTISCWECGPTLWLEDNQGGFYVHSVIQKAVVALLSGKIIAVKGIGGFHLMTLAQNTDSIQKLRKFKKREDKPFALMLENILDAQTFCEINERQAKTLTSPCAPIVILRKKKYSAQPISKWVAPDQSYFGIMLAYTPLHHLLLSHVKVPLVATSANLNQEPICFENAEALETLKSIADCFLLHNRNIIHPLEDSVIQHLKTNEQFIRRGRGALPFALPVSKTQQSAIGVGGHLKNMLAIYLKNKIYLSSYIGSLNSQNALKRFEKNFLRFRALSPDAYIIGDLHPGYASSQILAERKISFHKVLHHHAHLFAVMAEHQLSPPLIAFAWDGLGLGINKNLWGGEGFLVEKKEITHFASLYPILLPGGEKAIEEPRRIAFSICFTLWGENLWAQAPACVKAAFNETERNLIMCLMSASPPCSSMGRLFDAVAFLLGGPSKITFEGQSALFLEQLALEVPFENSTYAVCTYRENNQILVDWRPLFAQIVKELALIEKSIIAQRFHNWCVAVIMKLVSTFEYKKVLLSGGVFQNRILVNTTVSTLREAGYNVYYASKIPANDSALSVGQVYSVTHSYYAQRILEKETST